MPWQPPRSSTSAPDCAERERADQSLALRRPESAFAAADRTKTASALCHRHHNRPTPVVRDRAPGPAQLRARVWACSRHRVPRYAPADAATAASAEAAAVGKARRKVRMFLHEMAARAAAVHHARRWAARSAGAQGEAVAARLQWGSRRRVLSSSGAAAGLQGRGRWRAQGEATGRPSAAARIVPAEIAFAPAVGVEPANETESGAGLALD